MKRIIVFVFICHQAFVMNAQDALYPHKEDLQLIDNMQLRVQYDVDWQYDINNSEKVMHDKMVTEIGQSVCHSYIEREWNNEVTFNKNNEERGWRYTNAFSGLYSNIGEVFVGYPKGKTTNILSLDILGAYKYEEPKNKIKWTLTNEKFDTLDYHCTLATCSYAGRQYKAWFTEEIPVSFGPWKLGGLPGLIIKAETVDGDYSFVIAGIETVSTGTDINLWKRDFINSTKKKIRKQEKLLLARPDAVMDQMGIKYTTKTRNGVQKINFSTYDNPLEKE